MSNSYSSDYELLVDIYLNDVTDVAPFALWLANSARRMLNKSRIGNNLSKAKKLRDIIDRLFADAGSSNERMDDVGFLYRLLTECFDDISDDLMILSAFEMHAKSELLRKGYIVHYLDSPAELRQIQNTTPTSMRALRQCLEVGETVKVSRKTIGIETLLKSSYIKKYPLSDASLSGISEVRKRRNLVHFNLIHAWTVSHEVIELVAHLDSTLPQLE